MKTTHLQIMEHWIGKITDDVWWEEIGEVLYARGVLDFYDRNLHLYQIKVTEDGEDHLTDATPESTLNYIKELKKKKKSTGEIKIKCFNCTVSFHIESGGLQRCHLTAHSEGGADDPSNLIPLCRHCHALAPENDEQMMWTFLKKMGGKYYWPQKALETYIEMFERFPSFAGVNYLSWQGFTEGEGAKKYHCNIFKKLFKNRTPYSERYYQVMDDHKDLNKGWTAVANMMEEDKNIIREELHSFSSAHPFSPENKYYGDTPTTDVVKAIKISEDKNNWATESLLDY